MSLARPEDYIEWAVERLSEEIDSPSLRILAGLNPRFERDEVEPYFLQTCKELDIQPPSEFASPTECARLINRAYRQLEMTAEAAIRMMAALYQRSGYSVSTLWVWNEIEEELALTGSGHEGCFYPPEALASLEDVFEREWSLFDRGTRLSLPVDFNRYIKCTKCGHFGEPLLKHRTRRDKIRAAIPWLRRKPPLWHCCKVCGSYEYRTMADPEVRDAYFKQLEGEPKA